MEDKFYYIEVFLGNLLWYIRLSEIGLYYYQGITFRLNFLLETFGVTKFYSQEMD